MENIIIIIIEDQREVLEAIAKDLAFFEDAFLIEECDSADEAEELMESLDAEGHHIALVVSDHIMPGRSGVDFLIELNADDRFRATKKVLLTGLATHSDTINAINNAAIDRYLEKPWDANQLISYSKSLITEFILTKGIRYESYMKYLDNEIIRNKIHHG